jgi:hypothetical protein
MAGTSTDTSYVPSSVPVRHGRHENPGEKEKYLRLPEIKPNTLLIQADIEGGHCGVANAINKKVLLYRPANKLAQNCDDRVYSRQQT